MYMYMYMTIIMKTVHGYMYMYMYMYFYFHFDMQLKSLKDSQAANAMHPQSKVLCSVNWLIMVGVGLVVHKV